MTEKTMTNLGRAVMWVLALLIHVQFWFGFFATWEAVFPDASEIISRIFAIGVLFGIVPTLAIAKRIIP